MYFFIIRQKMKGLGVVFFMCIQLWILRESDCEEESCNKNLWPDMVLNICTSSELTMTRTASIDTVNVPEFQQTICECIIAPSHPGHGKVNFRLFLSGRSAKSMEFKINDIVLNSNYTRGVTYLTGETTLYFSADENNTTRSLCLNLYSPSRDMFNISCTKPNRIITTSLVTETTTSVTSKNRATEASKHNGTVSVATADTTETPKDNITTHTHKSSKSGPDSSGNLTAIVVPTVIGAVLILTASVILHRYIKRRRLVKETRHHEQELHATTALSEQITVQGQGRQNNASTDEGGPNISVNQYERLNMYVNDKLAGEMYQQLKADQNEYYQDMNDVKHYSGNQDRHLTKETAIQEGKGQENDISETSTNAYERLNMYINDTLPGEMYQQLQAEDIDNGFGKSVPVSEHRTIAKSDHKADTNENTSAVYTNAISQADEYDDIA